MRTFVRAVSITHTRWWRWWWWCERSWMFKYSGHMFKRSNTGVCEDLGFYSFIIQWKIKSVTQSWDDDQTDAPQMMNWTVEVCVFKGTQITNEESSTAVWRYCLSQFTDSSLLILLFHTRFKFSKCYTQRVWFKIFHFTFSITGDINEVYKR